MNLIEDVGYGQQVEDQLYPLSPWHGFEVLLEATVSVKNIRC